MSLRTDIAGLTAELGRLRTISLGEDAFAEDPARLMEASGLAPDPWQRSVLCSKTMQTLLLCTRQGGKSTVTAALALHTALCQPGALVLLLSPSLRQSQELFGKVVSFYHTAGEPVAARNLTALRVEFIHGSRIVALPGTEKTIRGYSGVDLLVIDEASRVLDELYYSVRPMLAVSGGRLVALTTPWGKRGFFYREWTGGGDGWQRVCVRAHDCRRISSVFLEEERKRMPNSWFRSEYLCEFTDTVDAVFRQEDIMSAFSDDVEPLFLDASIESSTTGLFT